MCGRCFNAAQSLVVCLDGSLKLLCRLKCQRSQIRPSASSRPHFSQQLLSRTGILEATLPAILACSAASTRKSLVGTQHEERVLS